MCVLAIIVAGSISYHGTFPCGYLPGQCHYEGAATVRMMERNGVRDVAYLCRPNRTYRPQ